MLCRGVLQTPLQIAPYTLLKFHTLAKLITLIINYFYSMCCKRPYKFENNENQKDDIFIFIVSYYFLSNRSSVVVSESVLRKNR